MTLLGGFQHWAGLLKLQRTVWFFTSFYWRKCSELYLKKKKKGRREKEEKREMWTLLTYIWWNLSVTRSHPGPTLALGGKDRLCCGWLPRSPGGNVQLPEVGIAKSPGSHTPARQHGSPYPHASRFPCSSSKHHWLVNPRRVYSSYQLCCQTRFGLCSS